MSEGRHQVQYGETTIEFLLSYAPRQTLNISVHPDLKVTVTAPENAPFEAIEAKVLQRARWILRQQRELELYLPHIPPRQYVSGETHRYLGRQYRLKVVEDSHEDVKLARGYLYVFTPDKANTERVRAQVENWYRRQATRVFQERLEALLPRFERLGISMPKWTIKNLKTRWGSCTEAGTITLNLRLIQVPKRAMDYVLVHELCHLVEHSHSQRFYLLLDRMMPDWRVRRQHLNQYDVS
jgi:predicted metal-dependent hydrolase